MKRQASKEEAGTAVLDNSPAISLVKGEKVGPVTQKELREYRAACQKVEDAQAEAAKIEAKIFAKLKAGATVQEGARVAWIKVTPGRRVPKYKELLTELHGKDYVEDVIAKTEPGADSKKLVVEYKKA